MSVPKMSSDEYEMKLKEIVFLAKSQREGKYSSKDDALVALELVQRLANLMIELGAQVCAE